MGMGALRKIFRGPVSLTGKTLVNEFRKVEQLDSHWELPFRRRYLASKEEECRSITKSLFMYGFTQWDVNTLLCGAFIAQCLLGIVLLSPISVIISFFATCCLVQLRVHRDKLTLHFSLASFGSYIILMINLLILQPKHRYSYGGVSVLLATSCVHFVILSLLGRHTVGRAFERFADTCLQFQVPSVVECHALLVGIIACLGITFAVVRLYCMTCACIVVVLFALSARVGIVVRPQALQQSGATEGGADVSPVSSTFIGCCFPIVRCVLSVIFAMMALAVFVASLLEGNVLSLRVQETFKEWVSTNLHVGEYTFHFVVLTYLGSISIGMILVVSFLFFLQLVLRSPKLRNSLHRRTIFMGKSCIDRKGNFHYVYYSYTVDASGYVVDFETLRKSKLDGYDKSSLTCYDIYLAMQRGSLHALCQRTLYCHVPILHLYTAEKDSNVLVRNRLRLEKMANELDEMVHHERIRRRAARLEQERLRRLQIALSNRPRFISSSIPCGLDIGILPQSMDDSFVDVRSEAQSCKRTFSVPIDLSLQDVDDIPAIMRMKDRLYQRRCVTTSVTDDFYWRSPGIINRVRCSWLDEFNEQPLISARFLKPANSNVNRDPTKGEFNFNKIDNTLSNIFMDLEIMGKDGLQVIRESNLGKFRRASRKTPKSNDASGRADGVCIDVSDDRSPVSRATGDMMSPVSEGASVTTSMPKPVQFIDIGTTKSGASVVDTPQPMLGSSQHGDIEPQRKWKWLDNAVTDVLSNTTSVGANRTLPDGKMESGDTGIKKGLDDDDVVCHRIRPIEEALEGQYYVNEHGQLVVKSGNRYVPARYHGERTVKKLAAFFSSPKNQSNVKETDDMPVPSESDEDAYVYDISKVVKSPTHGSMVYTLSNDVFTKSQLLTQQSPYIICTDSIEHDISSYPVEEYKRKVMDVAYPPVADMSSDVSHFVVTREYEKYPPFNLNNVVERKALDGNSLDRKFKTAQLGISGVEDSSESVHKDSSTVGELDPDDCVAIHREGSCGGSIVVDTVCDKSPTHMRRIAAARHLPLALDSRHEKIYHVLPEPRYNGAILERPKSPGHIYVESVATTPSTVVNGQRNKVNGSTGCDYTNRHIESQLDSATSPGSSVTTRSASVSSVRPVLPRRQWRNEFDFSPVAIHSAEDVMRELVQDVDIVDSAVEDAGSDVSYDFIFGR